MFIGNNEAVTGHEESSAGADLRLFCAFLPENGHSNAEILEVWIIAERVLVNDFVLGHVFKGNNGDDRRCDFSNGGSYQILLRFRNDCLLILDFFYRGGGLSALTGNDGDFFIQIRYLFFYN